MGRNLRFWLTAPDAAPFDPGDAPVALGALLVRLSRSHLTCALAAPPVIDAILARRYDLTAQEAAEMRETCERVERAAPDTSRFAAILRAAVDYHERRALALSLWEELAGDARAPDPERVALLAEAVLGVHPADLAPPRRAG
ncbi:TerB family tellurite resistance protein [Salipiger abyssi]|uniref:tellurite resistance TerB family protein n=1 Tax=Salipiger abyssi TaxID=1250539 RepID=UPI001A8E5D4B|nr:TerB family tellurite resistance protein [Salipiger abyssi]MBN9889424.1 TerB family tellurite resistance protein [Salipiger abyssi]